MIRVCGALAALLLGPVAVAAGTIASRSGNANETPAAFSTARRGICFLVMNIEGATLLRGVHTLPAKRVAIDDSQDE